jgi:hypothetical protein
MEEVEQEHDGIGEHRLMKSVGPNAERAVFRSTIKASGPFCKTSGLSAMAVSVFSPLAASSLGHLPNDASSSFSAFANADRAG